MIKPATPLAVLFFVAFVLLLLPTLSVPTIKAIPLATAPGKDNTIFTFGIFGWCGPSNCSGYHVGYSTDTIPGFDSNGDFNLPSGSRASLSAILIVHPIAALLALICAALAVTVHFRTAAHSPNFLLVLLIITFPTLLVALLAFLVDILLFVPHQQWPCYLELAGTIVITLCSVLTCAMRRTLVSRKARQRRIAENEDMNGSTYYSNKPQPPVFHDAPTYTREQAYARAESPPPLDPALENKLPRSAAFEAADDRTPLNAKEPSIRTNSTNGRSQRTPTATDASHTVVSSLSGTAPGGYGDQGRSPVSPMEGDVPPLPRGPIDARGGYNGRAGPRGGFGPRGGMPPPAMYGRGRGGLPPPRGGFAPRGGRGGYPPPGPPPPGAYGRGGYPPRGPFRGGPRGPPPPPGMRGGYPGPAGYMGRGAYPTGPQMPPTYATNETGYDDYIDSYADSTPQGPYGDARYADTPPLNHPNGPPQPLYSEPVTGYDAPPQHERVLPPPISSHTPPVTQNDSITRDPASFGFSGPRAFSPRTVTSRGGPTPPAAIPNHVDGPSGQAIEMDAMPRPPSAARESSAIGAYNASNVVELGSSTPRLATATPTAVSELHSHAQGPSTHAAEPGPPQTRSRKSSDAYYEDVDPRFAHDEPLPNQETSGNVPSALVPGYAQSNPANAHLFPPKRQPSDASYYSERDVSGMNPALESEEIDRTRSPAQSDTSNFTSISQRGINPNWRPGPGEIAQGPSMGPPGNGPPRPMRGGPGYGPPQGRGRGVPTDALLNDNPDFALPGAGRGRPYHHARGNSGDGGRYPAAV